MADMTNMCVRFLMIHFAVLLIAVQLHAAQNKPGSELTALFQPLSTPEQANHAEKQLKKTRDNEYLHLQLLMYYYNSAGNGKDTESAKALWARQVFWLIDHDPKSPAFDPGPEAFTAIQTGRGALSDDSLAAEAPRHWERVVASSPKDRIILQH